MDILKFKIRECFIIRPDQEKAWPIIILQKVKRFLIFLKHLSRTAFSHAYLMIFPNSNWNVLAKAGKCFDIRISKYCQMFTLITITQKKCLWKKTGIVWFNASKCVNYLENLISSQWNFEGNIPKSSHTPSFQLNQSVKLRINSNIVKLLVFCKNIWYIIWTKYTTSFGKINQE